ncbi:MAG: xanthine phosphoribosyltransferase [Alphaproteobacteria bacterium]
MADYIHKIQISWDDIKSDSAALAAGLRENFSLPDKILAVTRGGLIPAALVTRSLNIKRIETIGLESYHGQSQDDVMNVLKNADPAYLKNALIIDDLVDTGRTFEYLKPLTENCLFATLYAKPMGAKHSDFYIKTFPQDTWVDFPWEMDD